MGIEARCLATLKASNAMQQLAQALYQGKHSMSTHKHRKTVGSMCAQNRWTARTIRTESIALQVLKFYGWIPGTFWYALEHTTLHRGQVSTFTFTAVSETDFALLISEVLVTCQFAQQLPKVLLLWIWLPYVVGQLSSRTRHRLLAIGRTG